MAARMNGFRVYARQEAQAAGRPIYKGKPCPHGHPGFRYTNNKHCVGCRLALRKPRKMGLREEAIKNGQNTYQGKPCPHGHSGARRTSNRHCVECDRQEKRANAEYYVAYNNARVHRSPESWEKELTRLRNNATRNAVKIAAQRAHRMAVNKNTLRLLYYDS